MISLATCIEDISPLSTIWNADMDAIIDNIIGSFPRCFDAAPDIDTLYEQHIGSLNRMKDIKQSARALVGACWTHPTTQHKTMDLELAAVFSDLLAQWIQTARQHAANELFYRELLETCAWSLGPEVFIADDGSVMEEPLLLKVPELVAKLAENHESPRHNGAN